MSYISVLCINIIFARISKVKVQQLLNFFKYNLNGLRF